jgi:hypothetical protein
VLLIKKKEPQINTDGHGLGKEISHKDAQEAQEGRIKPQIAQIGAGGGEGTTEYTEYTERGGEVSLGDVKISDIPPPLLASIPVRSRTIPSLLSLLSLLSLPPWDCKIILKTEG